MKSILLIQIGKILARQVGGAVAVCFGQKLAHLVCREVGGARQRHNANGKDEKRNRVDQIARAKLHLKISRVKSEVIFDEGRDEEVAVVIAFAQAKVARNAGPLAGIL